MLLNLIYVIIALIIFGIIVSFLWNYTMPELFPVRRITITQAVALVFLINILFNGAGSCTSFVNNK